ncbi:hypothetical protein SASPL_114283 [Salvia splendens]|uniref:Cellulose synthase A n=1 Tax=Salvia splendens TaxID=180675 RepID=A0A8X8Y115_SALSN|nr:cellulose synthase-like protein E1 [Salvia splendens]KAG6423878.1 hypothetical protein SASPL_114283 [Salvia splendens]
MSENSLFETKNAKGDLVYKVFASSIFAGIILIWIYRATHVIENGRIVWMGMVGAEIWFGFYWILTQSHRWNRVYRRTFKERLSKRPEGDLGGVDIFVCTADPEIEPPMLVINTVLSVMAYDYPAEKLAVYLSDDAASDLTFYALLEASAFAKHWLPYCKNFRVEPRSPQAYFTTQSALLEPEQRHRFDSIKKLYEDMENRIELAKKLGTVSKSTLIEHRGFSSWDSYRSKTDHDAILHMIIDRDGEATDVEGCRLPTLVYLAREKRPHHFHNFKAGAMNALIRVSSEISNGPIILNVDCDMYSNDSQSIRDALCFFLDEDNGHEVAYVQYPQKFHNLTRNELYGGSLRVLSEFEFPGLDACGGPMYVGTGCFHRRDTLCGRKFTEASVFKWKGRAVSRSGESIAELEERVKALASCTFELNTQWGHEMGLKYGCPVEDVITGLSIQCRGWKSIFFNPERAAFLGLAATTLDQNLVQHKRWSEGDLQILLSKYSPICYGLGKINVGLIMGYCTYCFWSVNCFATLFYTVIPSLYLFKGVPLFPQVSSMWFLPFAYVVTAELVYSFLEYLWSGGTALGWWNEQRMWLYKRTSSYVFAVTDTLLKVVGYSDSGFVISAKVSDADVLERYGQEKMEFGATTPAFTILATLAMLNVFCLVGTVVRVIWAGEVEAFHRSLGLQAILCGVLVLMNLPLYNAAFVRSDKGSLPSVVTFKSTLMAVSLCSLSSLL